MFAGLRGIRAALVLAAILLPAYSPGLAQNIDTELMKATFELRGPKTPGQTSYGTVFILGKPLKDDPKHSYYVLVTAAHVLDEITGDQATLMLRLPNEDGTYRVLPFTLPIRANGTNLYTKNPSADVAVMYVRLPDELKLELIPISMLATDETIKNFEIHPGDELLCLGFPLAIDFNGFPVIRSGILASYPLTPSRNVKTYYYNFHVFPGNSGGPVYFSYSNRIFNGATNIGRQQAVMGIVVQQVSSTLPGFENTQIDVAVIVPSSFIIDTINMLPDKPD